MEEPEQQADGDRLHLGLAAGVHGGADRSLVEGDEDPVGAHALPHGEAQLARDQRGRPVPGQVVEGRAVLPADLDHVPESLGGHQRRAGPAALEQRVGGHRGAVREAGHGPDGGLDELERGHHPERLVPRGGRHLGRDQPAVGQRHEVGEGPTHVDPEPGCCHGGIVP
jgi:hypothetical protein